MPKTQYAIVQHSGAPTHAEFEHGLEQVGVTAAEAAIVRREGGIVFDTYMDADDFCQREQYPPSNRGLIPTAPGAFSKQTVRGFPIYQPGKRA